MQDQSLTKICRMKRCFPKLYSLRPPGAKILQGCVVAIDSVPSLRTLAVFLYPAPSMSLVVFSSAPPSTYFSLAPLSLSSSISRAASLPRSSLISEISQSLFLALLTLIHVEGVKTIPSFQPFPMMKPRSLSRNHVKTASNHRKFNR